MKKSVYMIKDWTGNILNFRGVYQAEGFCVPMLFKQAEDAEDYLIETLSDDYEDARQDVFVVIKE